MSFTIALDGPSGSGKSSLANDLSNYYQIVHIDTGAMYRAVAWACLNRHIHLNDEEGVVALCKQLQIELTKDQKVYVDGVDVTQDIRQHAISQAASDISTYPQVRQNLVEKQQALAQKADCIMDGRDIGTVVLPSASIKLFLTADPRVRAQRRTKELLAKGQKVSLDQVLEDVLRRDYQDQHRIHSPLKRANDAILVDNSSMTLQETLHTCIRLIDQKKEEVHD